MGRLLVEEIPYRDPLTVFAGFATRPGATFLDSARTDSALGRYSFVMADPFLTLKSRDGLIEEGETHFIGDPFAVLAKRLERYAVAHEPGLPPFQTGAAGYFAYDLGRHLERLPSHRIDDQPLPDLLMGFYGWAIAFDHAETRAFIMANGHPAPSEPERQRLAAARIAEIRQRLSRPPSLPRRQVIAPPRPDIERNAHEAMVRRAIDYILAGDIYQANITQRFSAELRATDDPFALYCALRRRNPAPFAAFLRHGEVAIVSASPERFLKLDQGRVETRPIKGTRPRGATPAEDESLRRELAASIKDQAENLMIVDLLRNDLSRVCRDWTVDVPVLFGLESYATVHHLVSVVTGELTAGKGPVDLLRAAFPGGSITGAPKIAAVDLIAALEPVGRGASMGAYGRIWPNGDLDLALTIRTFAVAEGRIHLWVGGGIVWDSDPAEEIEESWTKAAPLLAAIGAPMPEPALR